MYIIFSTHIHSCSISMLPVVAYYYILLVAGVLVISSTTETLPAAAEDVFQGSFCSKANETGDAYRSNLRALAALLVAGAKANNSAVGAVRDTAYGVALCRGDYARDLCAQNVNDTLRKAMDHAEAFGCAQQDGDVALYYDRHQVSFSSRDFLSGYGNAPTKNLSSTIVVSPAEARPRFDEHVGELVRAVADIAADEADRYATGMSYFKERGLKVYALMQCTIDMPPERCRACLHGLVTEFPRTFPSGLYGGRILGPRCTVRYETGDKFFNVTSKLSVYLHKPPSTCSSTLFTCSKLFRQLLRDLNIFFFPRLSDLNRGQCVCGCSAYIYIHE
jgi:hypothetical protein